MELGGASASPIVKAVLENIGRRYLVEHTEAEDGSWWADRYSDGWVVQGGKGTTRTSSYKTITLSIPFTDTNYTINATSFTGGEYPYIGSVTESSFSIMAQNHDGATYAANFRYVAQGYAA